MKARSTSRRRELWLAAGRRACPTSTIPMALVLALLLTGCTSKILKAENSDEILKNEEFERSIRVKDLPSTTSPVGPGKYVRLPGPDAIEWPIADKPELDEATPPKKDGKKTKPGKLAAATAKLGAATKASAAPKNSTGAKNSTGSSNSTSSGPVNAINSMLPQGAHQPSLEDGEGFIGRRPKVDPYRVGEKVTLGVSYFGVTAGDMTLEMRGFAQVNGRNSYRFAGTAVSTSVFAMFYAVDDWFETFVDFETLVPSNYALHVKESKQLRETRSVFDWARMVATWWDKKIDSDRKVEEKKKKWSIPAFSQNIFTAPQYLRCFTLVPGKKIVYRVAHEGENPVVTVEVLRREHILTDAGEFDTVVVKPRIEIGGVFKPVGDIFIWLTDDDRKLIVRLESKIKIGTIVASAKKIDPGQP